MNTPILIKRPVAFRVPRIVNDNLSTTEFRLFADESEARAEALALDCEYQGLYVRDGSVITMTEEEVLEAAIDRMSWPEIHAFQNELRKGQDYREDAGGFMIRAIRRLFGLPAASWGVVNYQQAARAMIEKAKAS